MKKDFFIFIKRRAIQLLHYMVFLLAKFYVYITNQNVKDIWLIAERGYDARDNAYVLYKYIKNNHPEIECKYVISKNSFDFERIDKSDVVLHNSWENYILFITAKILISTHICGYSPDMNVFSKLDEYNMLKIPGKKVYLTHFLLDRAIFTWNRHLHTIDLYTCSSRCDYDNCLKNSDYGKDVIKLTGTPRMDNIYKCKNNNTDNLILVMPTWRVPFIYMTKKSFQNTTYFKNYYKLINDKKLIDYLKENNYKLIFYPHIEVQKFIDCFESVSDRVIIGDAHKFVVEDLLLKSKLLITDYSSVHADFALLGKKVIYFQFDAAEEQSYRPWNSFFTFEKDGFGPIFDNLDTLINYIISQKSFDMDNIYSERVNKIFPIFDDNNCSRVFSAVSHLLN